MTRLILEAREAASWKRKEKKHRRGAFPALACGISYGKGQPEPMRLGGDKQDLMKDLLAHRCFHRVAGFQSAALSTWFPRCYQAALHRKRRLKELRPEFMPNFDNSVYSCMTVNFGPQTWTYIHIDSKNDPCLPCAVTSGGKYNWKLGGHMVLWDFGVILEFPPGTTILLSSAFLRHSNIPVSKGETRVSVTQYSAGSIRQWLEYGGRTEEALLTEDPEAYAREMAKRNSRWKDTLDMYSTIEELKAGNN
ncbi:hypothetical protein C8J55DRAFT_433510 [Lentinula edodes]|uniref:Uncharacterized protein n=1 Tax=Lentinula lateritia TaxID=40482 RepID=A0A9W9DJX6_9AGAR|nr:hypothetical protein C8J55DRAFT_433510 [Lentinula edodes]